MDARNVRIMRPYPDGSCEEDTVYIDEHARMALHIQWGEKILVVGRRKYPANIAPLRDEDCDCQSIRITETMRDHVYCEVGDEVLLYPNE